MCNTNDMMYCDYCQQYYRKDYIHICSGTINHYFCNGCGQYVFGNHMCPGTVTYGYSDKPSSHYKCPSCQGEFDEPANQGMVYGGYKCPFCGKEMKGLNGAKE